MMQPQPNKLSIHSLQQRGSALFIGMIILLVMSLIGINSLNTAALELKMASNIQQKAVSFQSAETTLRVAETAATVIGDALDTGGIIPSTGYIDIPGGGTAADITNLNFWIGAGNYVCHPVGCINENGRYVIEYLGVETVVDDPYNSSGASVTSIQPPPRDVHAFRITSRGYGIDRGAATTIQTIFMRNKSSGS